MSMEDVPPGSRPPDLGSHRAVPPGPPPEPVEFTEEQKRELAQALYQTEVELLQAITRAAAPQAGTHSQPRTPGPHLTPARAPRRATAGQAEPRSPFFPGPPPWIGP